MAKSSRSKFLNLIGLQTSKSRLAVILGVSFSLYLISYGWLVSLPSISVFARLGIPSPSIGLTRAYWMVLHGSFSDAWHMNKLIYLVVPVLIAIVCFDIYCLLKNTKHK